ncbi:hypothetical protein HJC23_013564 [Cyclotella cryptica]|uniref:Uncharacterized protein n=1 Tax=Cyclotella cryptica TaxID=29204 RepID=A0ABD3PB75_9STRA|eukprot:CCRYP_015939-RA/>CCRYP_015939-RA protein AED:0.07 eAED:0.07 QI:1084/1/1/1/0/0/3/178/1033
MSRYDPNSMTRVLGLENYDFRERSSSVASDSDEDESVSHLVKTSTGDISTSIEINKKKGDEGQPKRGGFFGMKRLGLSRKDRERDAIAGFSNASADAAAGSVKSDTESKLRGSLETDSDDTYMTLGTALTGDHVNALLKAHKEYSGDGDPDECANVGVEDYWKATEPGTVLRHSSQGLIPKDEDDEEVPITDRIGEKKAERRSTSNSMLTAHFDDGTLDLSGEMGCDEDIEDDLLKYAAAIVQHDSIPSTGSEDKGKRPLFVKPTSAYSDVASNADTEKFDNTVVKSGASDIESGFNYITKNSIEKFKVLLTGGNAITAVNANETYDLRDHSAQPKQKKDKNSRARRASDGTSDSLWSWSQAAATVHTRTSDGFNRRTSNETGEGANYSNDNEDDDDKSNTSGGTFDSSWLGLGNMAKNNGRGGWRDTRRTTLTPFVDYDGHSFHQRNAHYRPGERNLKRCIVVFFVLAVVALSGALIGLNITTTDDSEPMTKNTSSSASTEEEMLAVRENVNQACSPSSVASSDGRHMCQQLCHGHFCCFDNDKDGYNCQDDPSKSCSIYSECDILVADIVNGGPTLVEIVHVNSEDLNARIKDACSNLNTSMGKIECHQACDDHMCCFEADTSKSCRGRENMDCSLYEACAGLTTDVVANKGTVSTVVNKPPGDSSLPSWDKAESNNDVLPLEDYTSDESEIQEHVVTIGSGSSSESDIDMNQIFIPSPTEGNSDVFVPLGGSVTSSQGVTEQNVDDACHNLTTASGRKKCAKMCASHMCCFESDVNKACLTNTDCSVYGSCVYLGSNSTFDATLSFDDDDTAIEGNLISNAMDDRYGYSDDDMYVVDTEVEDVYESTVYHIGNRTTFDLDDSVLSSGDDLTMTNEMIENSAVLVNGNHLDTGKDSTWVTEQDVDAACQNLSTTSGRKKCANICASHMCCFDSDVNNACLMNDDCSLYGSCVYLGSNNTFDATLSSHDDETVTESHNGSDTFDDRYSDSDDDMYVVDTEEGDVYDTTVYHVGNRTTMHVDVSDSSSGNDSR